MKNKFQGKNFNRDLVKKSVEYFLIGIGEDLTREDLIETPERVTRMWEILLGGYIENPDQHLKLFTAPSKGAVMTSPIQVYTFCPHHLQLVVGQAHIAYIPNKTVIGFSKIGRIIRVFAKKLIKQETLTKEIAEYFYNCKLKPKGVMVILDMNHHCVSLRGARIHGAITRTIETQGIYKKDKELQRAFEDFVNNANKNVYSY